MKNFRETKWWKETVEKGDWLKLKCTFPNHAYDGIKLIEFEDLTEGIGGNFVVNGSEGSAMTLILADSIDEIIEIRKPLQSKGA